MLKGCKCGDGCQSEEHESREVIRTLDFGHKYHAVIVA